MANRNPWKLVTHTNKGDRVRTCHFPTLDRESRSSFRRWAKKKLGMEIYGYFSDQDGECVKIQGLDADNNPFDLVCQTPSAKSAIASGSIDDYTDDPDEFLRWCMNRRREEEGWVK